MGTVSDDIGCCDAHKRDKSDEGRQLSPEQAAAAAMVAEARQRGLEVAGPGGLLKLFTKNVLETALNEEIAEHLGYEKHQARAGRQSANVRNGARSRRLSPMRWVMSASTFPVTGKGPSRRRS